MRTPTRFPITAYAVLAALAAVGVPALAASAWRAVVWQTPGTPDAVASLEELAAVAALLGLLAAGQAVRLVSVRREVHDAAAARDAGGLQAAARRGIAGARLAAGVGAAALLVYLTDAVAEAGRAAGPGFDWLAFGLTVTLLNGPALIALAAPAALVGLGDAGPVGLARAVRRAGAATLVAILALGVVLLGASAGFAVAQAACRPDGSAAVCGAANASIGQVVGLIGPPVTFLALAVAERGLRALWSLRTGVA